MSRDWVVDASVCVKLYVVEELSDEADTFWSLASRLFVPEFFYIECTNILWKHTWRYGYSPDEVRKDLVDLCELTLFPISVVPLLSPAFELALQHHISAYDAAYAVLARGMGVPLVTADRKLVGKLAGTGTDIRWLGDLDL